MKKLLSAIGCSLFITLCLLAVIFGTYKAVYGIAELLLIYFEVGSPINLFASTAITACVWIGFISGFLIIFDNTEDKELEDVEKEKKKAQEEKT